jgi:DNA-directed RNA polymerase subunit RPC12/RpoP
MGQRASYTCKSCMHNFQSEVPQFDSPYDFGEKIACTNCGKIGANYQGAA